VSLSTVACHGMSQRLQAFRSMNLLYTDNTWGPLCRRVFLLAWHHILKSGDLVKVRFQILTVTSVMTALFWVVTPCIIVRIISTFHKTILHDQESYNCRLQNRRISTDAVLRLFNHYVASVLCQFNPYIAHYSQSSLFIGSVLRQFNIFPGPVPWQFNLFTSLVLCQFNLFIGQVLSVQPLYWPSIVAVQLLFAQYCVSSTSLLAQ
jgi:hypothetical protein